MGIGSALEVHEHRTSHRLCDLTRRSIATLSQQQPGKFSPELTPPAVIQNSITRTDNNARPSQRKSIDGSDREGLCWWCWWSMAAWWFGESEKIDIASAPSGQSQTINALIFKANDNTFVRRPTSTSKLQRQRHDTIWVASVIGNTVVVM